MPDEFQEGQHIIIEQLIENQGKMPVPPGYYVVAEAKHDLLGNLHYRIRSVPDEDIEAEVDSESLSKVARIDAE